MKLSLLEIEKKLQAFFEERLLFPSTRDPYHSLTKKVLSAMRSGTKTINKKPTIPNVYRIIINPSKREIFSEIGLKIWKEFMENIISDVIKDENLYFASPIHIQHFFKNTVQGEFVIEYFHSARAHEKTANIIIDDQLPSKVETNPGYLISPDGSIFIINKVIINIGRDNNNELCIDNLRISRVHAQIRQLQGNHVLFDLSSTSGTKVNGEKITQKILRQGDVIEIADYALIYSKDQNMSQMKEEKGIHQTRAIRSAFDKP